MIILEDQTGLNGGLNKGLKIGKMLKKNVRLKNVSVKNAVKIGKAAIPLATAAASFIPAGAVAGKILDSKAGKLFTKIKNGKAVKFATKIGKSKVGKFAVKNVVNPTLKSFVSGSGSGQDNSNAPQNDVMQNATPTPQQLDTIAQVKGVSAETLSSDIQASEASPNDAQLETISNVKQIPIEDLKEESATLKETAKTGGSTPTDKPNYTIPIVIAAGAVGAVLLIKSSKSN